MKTILPRKAAGIFPYLVFSALALFLASLMRLSFLGGSHFGGGEQQVFPSLQNTPTGKYRLPDAIVAGARKCGTKFFTESLGLHPRIIKGTNKEYHFFDKYFYMGWEGYHQMLTKNGRRNIPQEALLVEKTPQYLNTLGAPQAIAKLKARVIVILCDPVTRVLSDILSSAFINKRPLGEMVKLALDWRGNINTYSTFIFSSFYSKLIPEWLDHFKVNSTLLFIDGENLALKPWEELERAQNFLGLRRMITRENFSYNSSKEFYCLRESGSLPGQHPWKMRCLTQKGHRNREANFDQGFIEQLRRLFRPFNQDVYRMVGKDLGWD